MITLFVLTEEIATVEAAMSLQGSLQLHLMFGANVFEVKRVKLFLFRTITKRLLPVCQEKSSNYRQRFSP
jgi:hypothetical protein